VVLNGTFVGSYLGIFVIFFSKGIKFGVVLAQIPLPLFVVGSSNPQNIRNVPTTSQQQMECLQQIHNNPCGRLS